MFEMSGAGRIDADPTLPAWVAPVSPLSPRRPNAWPATYATSIKIAVATTNFVIAPPLRGWSTAAAPVVAEETGVPQLLQKRSPETSGRLHAAHETSRSAEPHPAQKCPVPVSPHRGHLVSTGLVGSGMRGSLMRDTHQRGVSRGRSMRGRSRQSVCRRFKEAAARRPGVLEGEPSAMLLAVSAALAERSPGRIPGDSPRVMPRKLTT